jgi:GAF domain-containing protein
VHDGLVDEFDDVAARFARLAVEMHDAIGVDETVHTVVEFALQALNCQYAGIALYSHGGRPEVPAVTHPTVAEIYRFQMFGHDGPLVACMQEHVNVLVPDTVAEQRWPEWAKKVLELGVRSVLDVPLRTAGGTVGVLGLYSVEPNAFSPDEEAIAHIVARHASVALASARREQNLAIAVDARKLVGQAMGILMERFDLDSDHAFEVLKRYSQQTNTKLHDVARELIETRTLPRS